MVIGWGWGVGEMDSQVGREVREEGQGLLKKQWWMMWYESKEEQNRCFGRQTGLSLNLGWWPPGCVTLGEWLSLIASQSLSFSSAKPRHVSCKDIMKTIVCGLPWWLRWLRVCLQCGRPGFHPWVRKIPWRREWQPTPVFWPGELHRQRSLAGYSPWDCKESGMTEQLTHT